MHLGRFGTIATALLGLAALGGCGSVSGLETQARIMTQPSCSDFFFPIYFADRSAEVGAPARRVLAAAGKRSAGCRIQEVKVVGLPSPTTEDPELVLPRERASRVAQALAAAGFPSPTFQLSPLGEAGDSLAEAKRPRRRADVFVTFER